MPRDNLDSVSKSLPPIRARRPDRGRQGKGLSSTKSLTELGRGEIPLPPAALRNGHPSGALGQPAATCRNVGARSKARRRRAASRPGRRRLPLYHPSPLLRHFRITRSRQQFRTLVTP